MRSRFHLLILATPLLAVSLLNAQETARDLCDDTDSVNSCPGDDCQCTDDSLEIVFTDTSTPMFEYDVWSPGRTVATRVILRARSAQIRGYSLGVAHDPSALSIVAESPGLNLDDTASQAARSGGFVALRRLPGGYILAVVLNLEAPVVIPVEAVPVVNATYQLESDVGAAGALLELSEELGSPPTRIVLTIDEFDFPERVAGPEQDCVNGEDDDGDGLTDRDDPDCVVRRTVSRRPRKLVDGLIRRRGELFRRGDADADGRRNIADAVFLLFHLFRGRTAPPCPKAADVDDNGRLQITDAIVLLNFLFLRGRTPSEPFAGCGLDTTSDELECEAFPACSTADPG